MTHHSFVPRLWREHRQRCSQDAGQMLVMAAVMLPVLLGCVGLVVDVGYALQYRRNMQMAADAAALAGARATRNSPSITASDLAVVVRLDATKNGFTHGTKNLSVVVCRPGVDYGCTTQYVYSAANEAVKVTITQPRGTFIRVLGVNSLDVGVTAVAASAPTSAGTANIIALDPNCTAASFHASGGVAVTVNGSVWVNSCDQNGTKATGGTPVNASDGIHIGCTATALCGNYQQEGGSLFTPAPSVGNPQLDDPLADLQEPLPSGPTFNDPNINSGTETLQPGIYNKGITIRGGTVTFAPGIYFLDGNSLDIKGGATVLGSGVMFYAYNNASLIIQAPTTTVTMSAPTSGAYRGIWWFQQRSNPEHATITAGPLVNISGTFYIINPGSELNFAGNADSGILADYTVFVVWHFKISGGATFNANFSPIGGTPLRGALALSE